MSKRSQMGRSTAPQDLALGQVQAMQLGMADVSQKNRQLAAMAGQLKQQCSVLARALSDAVLERSAPDATGKAVATIRAGGTVAYNVDVSRRQVPALVDGGAPAEVWDITITPAVQPVQPAQVQQPQPSGLVLMK